MNGYQFRSTIAESPTKVYVAQSDKNDELFWVIVRKLINKEDYMYFKNWKILRPFKDKILIQTEQPFSKETLETITELSKLL